MRVGGYYRARDGHVYGPMDPTFDEDRPWRSGSVVWTDAGTFFGVCDLDLVEEVSPETRTTRMQILEFARKGVTEDRNNRYGEPEDNFKTIAAYWDVFLGNRKPGALRAEEVARMMVLLKNARLHAKSDDIDGWVDMAGYAACGGEVANAK